ncbi:MAG: hypothetical protein C5B52_11950 [Bacteroidetes bacterium]|nr:MAG: hypothetical protein C5B52_11950 [Bacteroidota bacterium]
MSKPTKDFCKAAFDEEDNRLKEICKNCNSVRILSSRGWLIFVDDVKVKHEFGTQKQKNGRFHDP